MVEREVELARKLCCAKGTKPAELEATKKETMMATTRKKAVETVVEYAIRYASNRGLKATFPRLVVGMMPELSGWPVRNADGGNNIAHFASADEADAAIATARKKFRAAFSVAWFNS